MFCKIVEGALVAVIVAVLLISGVMAGSIVVFAFLKWVLFLWSFI